MRAFHENPIRIHTELTFINPESVSSNGWHSGAIFFKPEKNLEFFRLKKCP